MKKIKRFMPLLLTACLLIFPLNVQAAKKQLAAGTKSAKVTMTLENLQSFEGEFTCKAADKKSTITLKSISAKASGNSSAMYSTSGNRIFMVGTGDAVTTIIELDLEFSKDGKYTVVLDGGRTDKNGEYKDFSENKNQSLGELTIIIGEEVVAEEEEEEEEQEDKKTTVSSEKKTTTTKKRTTSSKKTEVESEEENTAITGKGGKNDVDYSALEKALKDANSVIGSDKELKEWQSLINSLNNGVMLLDSDDQEKVDAAAEEIQRILEKMVGASNEVKKPKNEKGSNVDFGKILKIALPILGLIALLGITYWLWKKAKNKPADYDGAPMVDYDIGEDDDKL